MPQAFRGYHLLLVITCDQTNFMIAVPLRDRTAQMVAEALIYRVIYLFGPPRQIICDEATEFSSAIIQAILCMCHICCFESKDVPTQMTKQSFTIIYFITFKKTIHFKLICKNVHS